MEVKKPEPESPGDIIPLGETDRLRGPSLYELLHVASTHCKIVAGGSGRDMAITDARS